MAAPANKTIGDLNGKWILVSQTQSHITHGVTLPSIPDMTYDRRHKRLPKLEWLPA